MLIGLVGMLTGTVNHHIFAYFSTAAVFYAILLPQLAGPPYTQIVALLVRIRFEIELQGTQKVDSLTDVLTRKV
jgi:hypothetical protein